MLHTYIITVGTLTYPALATSACAAICAALDLHGVRAISARRAA